MNIPNITVYTGCICLISVAITIAKIFLVDVHYYPSIFGPVQVQLQYIKYSSIFGPVQVQQVKLQYIKYSHSTLSEAAVQDGVNDVKLISGRKLERRDSRSEPVEECRLLLTSILNLRDKTDM